MEKEEDGRRLKEEDVIFGAERNSQWVALCLDQDHMLIKAMQRKKIYVQATFNSMIRCCVDTEKASWIKIFTLSPSQSCSFGFFFVFFFWS